MALRWDPQAACDKVDHRIHHQFWCKKKLDPPFDRVVLTCDEIGEPFSGEGRALEGNKFVISADDVILGRHGGGARECKIKNSTLLVRVLEFETELRGQEWLQEKSIKLKRVADTETSVYFDEEKCYIIYRQFSGQSTLKRCFYPKVFKAKYCVRVNEFSHVFLFNQEQKHRECLDDWAKKSPMNNSA